MKKLFRVMIMLTGLILFFSCTTNGSIVLANDDSGSFVLDSKMSANLYKTMIAFGDIDESENVFSSDLVKTFFTQAGLTLSSVIIENPREISFSGHSPDIKNVLNAKSQPITITERGAKKVFTLLLNDETMLAFISLLNEDSLMYLDLLQAPLFTREEMSAEEYEEFIAALYGQKLSNDLKDSYVTLDINIPKATTEASVYPKNLAKIEKSYKKITFNIKLSELLANSSEARFEIIWE